MAAPDHADRLVTDSLPTLCDILKKEDGVLGVYVKSLCLLCEIVKSSHSAVVKSGIVVDLVRRLR